MITQAELKERLHYDPETGVFTRLRAVLGGPVGSHPNCKDTAGYIMIRLMGRRYSAHRLAWLYVYGIFPTLWLDHKNTIKIDNWIDNLREATPSQNKCNQHLYSSSTTKLKGVSKCGNKWKSSCSAEGKKHYLGLYDTPELASTAYLEFAKLHHGEFLFTAV